MITTSAQTKRGRKSKPHQAADGTYINGLRRRHDGRWQITMGPRVGFCFSEVDETKAIIRARFLIDGAAADPTNYHKHLAHQHQGFIDWAAVAKEIIARPKWVAKATGIEQISYLRDLKAPEKLPTFDELKKVWMDLGRCSILQRKKVARAWDDFVDTADVDGLDDINPQTVIEYQDEVFKRGISAKQQQHLFSGIRRVLRFAKSRAMAMDTIAKAISYLEILKPSETSISIDPKPLSVDEWKQLYGAADGDNKAMILLMLNGAFYLGEVIRLEWDDIKNGCIVTHREKTGQERIAGDVGGRRFRCLVFRYVRHARF